jgi:RNA-directed DNA polymerase
MMEISTNMTGASPGTIGQWHSIDWKPCYKNIRRLQARIVKAIRIRRWNKVKALQRLLTHSFSGRALAVRRVTENRGKKTPGVDGITWSTPKSKYKAILSLKSRGYKPLPLRRVYIPKSNGKRRPLSIPTMKDRAMQALYAMALDPIAETTGDGHSYGFRKERSTADAIEQSFNTLARKDRAKWILEADIKGCFDNINHEWLIKHIPMDKTILKKWLKVGFMERKVWSPTSQGTPQGGIISPILANMTLDGLQNLLSNCFPKRGSEMGKQVNLIRYADDIIITAKTKEILEIEVLPVVTEFLTKRGLELSKDKTKITHIDDGFDFLGQNIRKYKGKLLIKPSKENVKKFLKSIREFIKATKTDPQEEMIKALNPKIRGWCEYHKHVVSKKTFSKIRHEIWKMLWQWAKRRHPSKNKLWIKNKYFVHDGKQDWCFAATTKDARSGKEKRIYLFHPGRMPILRHTLLKQDCNPYDPEWYSYIQKRQNSKTSKAMKRRGLYQLWTKQRMICPICKQAITSDTEFDIHHILGKSKGGTDDITNLMMLHINCHKQCHNTKRGEIL